MTIQRSNTATRLRTQAGSQIFKCDLVSLKTAARRYQTFKNMIGWREVESEGQTVVVYDTWDVEILHSTFHGALDIHTVFLNPVLIRVSPFILST